MEQLSSLPEAVAEFVRDPSRVTAALRSAPQAYLSYVREELRRNPEHVVVEVGLVLFILYVLLVKRSYNPRQRGFGDRGGPPPLTDAEVNEVISEWRPEPLCPPMPERERAAPADETIVEREDARTVSVRGVDRPLLAFASFDALGFAHADWMKRTCREAMDRYTLGSCGPRGFYGTFDAHLTLESELAAFLGTEEAITYSDNTATITSAIPAFAKRGDLLIVDDGVHDVIHMGAFLSRAEVRTFRHNDMADLERVLREQQARDRRRGLDGSYQRRFIVIEGLYRNTGDVAHIEAIVHLKNEYRYRLICDETLSFGVLGRTGRGITEHANMAFANIDIMTGSLDTALGCVGGFCAGPRDVVDHQRLSGAGYCFSASAPPFTLVAAVEALRRLRSNPALLAQLAANAAEARRALAALPGLELVPADADSPIIHLRLAAKHRAASVFDDRVATHRIAAEAMKHGVFVCSSKYMNNKSRSALIPASIRVSITVAHTSADIATLARALAAAATTVLGGGATSASASAAVVVAASTTATAAASTATAPAADSSSTKKPSALPSSSSSSSSSTTTTTTSGALPAVSSASPAQASKPKKKGSGSQSSSIESASASSASATSTSADDGFTTVVSKNSKKSKKP